MGSVVLFFPVAAGVSAEMMCWDVEPSRSDLLTSGSYCSGSLNALFSSATLLVIG